MKPFFVLALFLRSNILLLSVTTFSLFVGTGATVDAPAIVLVPGAFHQAAVYEKVIRILHRDHYDDITAIDLPSVGAVVGREPDIEATRRVVVKKLRDGKDVLLVGNSYGGTVIGEAVKGLKESQVGPYARSGILNLSSRTPNHGHGRGRILGLVFISGYIPYITDVTHPETKPDIHTVSPSFFRFASDGKVYWDNDLANFPPEKTFYNALDPAEQKVWVKRLEFSSFEALAANSTYIPYTGDFKCTYVIGERDNSIPPAFAQTYINQPGAKFEVVRLDADHVPMLSRPEDVARLIKKAAGGKTVGG